MGILQYVKSMTTPLLVQLLDGAALFKFLPLLSYSEGGSANLAAKLLALTARDQLVAAGCALWQHRPLTQYSECKYASRRMLCISLYLCTKL